MPFKPAILWTDALFYLLLIAIIAFVVYVRMHPILRQNWQQVFRRPLATFSCVILLAYLLLALLDCLHFHPALPALADGKLFYSHQVKSVLDLLLGRLGESDNSSYSAPFAYAFVPNTPPLYIVQLILLAIGKAVLIWLIITTAMIRLSAHHAQQSFIQRCQLVLFGKTTLAWRTILFSIGLILLSAFISKDLSSTWHIFGTNLVGQDVFYQSLKSIRTGIIIGTLTTLLMLPFAAILGAMAGYFGGWVDDIIQYIYITLSSIPGVLLITAAVLALQLFMQNHPWLFPDLATRADARLLILCAILGVTGWTDLCRLLRGETLKLREIDFVQAAVVMGAPSYKIIARHILPNVAHIILITVVLSFSALVLAEAVLSYVGIGVDPSTISWGNMINSARLELAREPTVWWPLCAAFIFMFILVLAANLFADAVRDAFDPRLSEAA